MPNIEIETEIEVSSIKIVAKKSNFTPFQLPQRSNVSLDNEKIISPLIQGCKEGKRESQKELYQKMYSYGMSVCLRYSKDIEEAKEILNDGFMKIFTKISQYSVGMSFKSWARRIWINAAIDYYRRNEKYYHHYDSSKARNEEHDIPNGLDNLSEEEILQLVQKLPPAYRMVFNMYVIEGYAHKEIAEQLGISEGTSKSNLAKARAKLKQMLDEIVKYNQANEKL